ncbi:hypothetical protein F5146DRAFT_997585 [Armillaria mellea]|nr:hypothetical protein F5146DRAFT_997585 [Armillaria mellea]
MKVFQSCIDRIYVTDKILEMARQWKIQPVGIADVDHDMVSMQITHEDAPLQGKGRWACLNGVLKDFRFKSAIKELGIKAQEEIKSIKQSGRTPTENPQRIYEKFITEAMHQARAREQTVKTRGQQRESDLNQAISRLAYDNILNDSQQSERLANLKKELKNLKKEEYNNTRKFMAAKDHLKGETVSKYYFQINKETKPRDIIQALEIRDTLQNDGLDIEDETWESAMRKVFDTNIMVSPSEENKERLSKNDSAPRINGATNKFFKVFNDCFIEDEWKGIPSFDIKNIGNFTNITNILKKIA